MEIRVARVERAEKDGAIRAFVDLEFGGGVRVNEFKIIQKGGLPPFLAPPSRRCWEQGETAYVHLAVFLTREVKEAAERAALAAWDQSQGRLAGTAWDEPGRCR